MRLDLYLAKNGLAKSRSRAAELISGGFVTVNGIVVTKNSFDVGDNSSVSVIGEEHSFVGRGGMKLDAALAEFKIDVSGKICADIGASTGGFTDCLLRRGASHVFAVDSGHDQLDLSLREDTRVTNIENCNARYLTKEIIPEKCSIVVCDLSFISQSLVIPAISRIIADGGYFVSLIKPQFECGREALGKGGIVKDKKQHLAAIRKILEAAAENNLAPQKIMKSPIKGGDGNTEFLFFAVSGGKAQVTEKDIGEAVNE
ncbi:MAG: TlyA family RNA methyltransferase [Ruminococcaceae bacterium]|nr:TlyA family RNA methyltransferase [Oscillospiraceae bacterium]